MLLLQILIDGFAISALYGIGAVGFTLIFGVSGVLNLSHGATMVVAAVVAWLVAGAGSGSILGGLAGILAALATAFVTYFMIVRPIQRSSAIPNEEKEIFVLTGTLLWGIMIQVLIAYFTTDQPHTVTPLIQGVVSIAGVRTPTNEIVTAAICWVAIALLWLFVNRSRAGKALLAASMNPRGVTLLGYELANIYVLVWAIYGVLAGIAGVLLAMFLGVSSTNVGTLTASAFSIVVLGGLGSVSGSLIAAYVVGYLETITAYTISPAIRTVPALLLLVLVVYVRPQGLLGAALMRALLASRLFWITILIVVILACFPLAVSGYILGLLTLAYYFGVFSMAWDLLFGFAGEVNFGPTFLIGLGAYTAGMLDANFGPPLWVCIIAGALAAVIGGVLLALPALRLRGPYFGLVTLVAVLILQNVIVVFAHYTGGEIGLTIPDVLSDSTNVNYEYALAFMVISGAILFGLSRSAVGLILQASGQDAVEAQALGFNVVKHKLAAFCVSALFSGLAGAMLVFYMGTASVDTVVDLALGVQVIIAAVLGGRRTILGAAVGAIFLIVAGEILRPLGQLSTFVVSAVALAVILFFPNGLLGYVLNRGRALMAEILEVAGLTKRFGGLVAVKDVGFTIKGGEILGLIGPNGSGKSTVMKLIMGIERPNAGSVRLDGAEMAGWPSHRIARSGIGIVFQHSRPLHRQTVLENIKLALLPDSLLKLAAEPHVDAKARAIAERVGLGDVMNRHPSTLPFADLRRMEMAKAIARDPKVVLVDEPFAGLTSGEVRVFSELIDGFRREGRAVLLVDHNVKSVAALVDRVFAMYLGERIAEGSADEVMRNETVRRVYLGGAIETHARGEIATSTAPPILDVKDVSVLYGKAQALERVSLRVHEGEFVSVVGLNGAGKTTLFNAISGLVPYAGEIDWRGASLRGRTPASIARGGVAQCPETRELFGDLNVRENLDLGGNHLDDAARRKQLGWLLELFPILRERQNQAARTLSGGEQQMLAIARALMMQPKLLILDEPTLGLAPVILEQISKALALLRSTTDITVLLGEQNVTFALPHADRVYVLEHARIIWEGDPARFAAEMGTGYL